MCATDDPADVAPVEALASGAEWKGEVLPIEPVDICRYAQRLTGVGQLHAVIGGFHLTGPLFEPIIKAQAGSPLASSATSSVSSVTIASPTQAKVVYSILVGGSPALTNQPGVAVYQSGIWKVGDQSFCALLTLENSGKAPAACPSAAG